MEFKIRAYIRYSRDLTIEANDIKEAVDKANEMMQGKIPAREVKFEDVTFKLMSHALDNYTLVPIEGEEED